MEKITDKFKHHCTMGKSLRFLCEILCGKEHKTYDEARALANMNRELFSGIFSVVWDKGWGRDVLPLIKELAENVKKD